MEVLWLVKNGVPWAVAQAMPDEERLAAAVVFAGFEGQEFSWETLTFRQRK